MGTVIVRRSCCSLIQTVKIGSFVWAEEEERSIRSGSVLKGSFVIPPDVIRSSMFFGRSLASSVSAGDPLFEGLLCDTRFLGYACFVLSTSSRLNIFVTSKAGIVCHVKNVTVSSVLAMVLGASVMKDMFSWPAHSLLNNEVR